MKLNTRSFGFKLWIYFVLFTALIFTVLWLLQTVFLQSFYNAMLISNTKQTAEQIISGSSEPGINSTIDTLAHKNSLLVFVTKTDGTILYSSDAFKETKGHGKNGNGFGEKKLDKHSFRSLPEYYDSFLAALQGSDSGTTEFYTDNYFAYGAYIDYYDSDEQSVLYVVASIDPVGASVTVISIMLVWVTILSLIIGFLLSWLIARKFAVPVKKLSEKAKRLGENDYTAEFKKGLCSELDDLNETLDKTNCKLIESRNYQMELLADVSHDLRTPLTMIKGYAEMVRDISREDEAQCTKDIDVIIKEADRLTALVNEIMEYSELKTRNMKLNQSENSDGSGISELTEHSRVDLSSLVKKTADSFDSLYKHQGYIIEENIESNVFTPGLQSRLERALYNLVDNAVRHTRDSRKVRITLRKEGTKAIVEVRDFGSGIPDSEIDHIWDRYYTSRMRQGKGVSGIGLAIVKQTTELHNGRCYARNEPDKGCTFVIELPLC